MDRLTVPDEKIEGGFRRAVIDVRAARAEAMNLYWRLKSYEDTWLTPEEILDGKMLTGWIPVDERMPGDDIEVAVTVCGKGEIDDFVSADTCIAGIWQTWNGVIAWMPLPEPYKPDK